MEWNTNKLQHDNLEEPISRFIHTDYTTLDEAQTVGQTLLSLRGKNLGQKIVYFYVIDADRKLLGVVPTRRLLMSDPETPIRQIMVANVISIPDTMSVIDACEFFVMHRLLAFPVVDAANHLLGVVDVGLFTDEMFGVTEKQAADDVFQLIGINIAAGRRASPWSGFANRFPWLMCNIAGGVACAFIAGMYERFLDSVIVLALFMPVVLTLAEGVSMQSMTITLQTLRQSRIDWRAVIRSVQQELLTAILLGAASGFVVGIISFAWKRNGLVSVAIGGSIAMAIVTACLLGVLLPTIVRLLRGDPKIAAGPLVLAVADVATLLFYFNLSNYILNR